jgi:hypothetical protein
MYRLVEISKLCALSTVQLCVSFGSYSKTTTLFLTAFTGWLLHFTKCVHGQLPFGIGGIGEVCHPTEVVRSAVRDIKTSGEIKCTTRWRTSQCRNCENTGDRS